MKLIIGLHRFRRNSQTFQLEKYFGSGKCHNKLLLHCMLDRLTFNKNFSLKEVPVVEIHGFCDEENAWLCGCYVTAFEASSAAAAARDSAIFYE